MMLRCLVAAFILTMAVCGSAAQEEAALVSRIAFGSCANQSTPQVLYSNLIKNANWGFNKLANTSSSLIEHSLKINSPCLCNALNSYNNGLELF